MAKFTTIAKWCIFIAFINTGFAVYFKILIPNVTFLNYLFYSHFVGWFITFILWVSFLFLKPQKLSYVIFVCLAILPLSTFTAIILFFTTINYYPPMTNIVFQINLIVCVVDVIIAIHFGPKFLYDLKHRAEKEHINSLELARDTLEIQLRVLQAKVDPHFITQKLTLVNQMVDSDKKKALSIQMALIRFLHYSLTQISVDQIPIKTETEMIDAYLSILKLHGPYSLYFQLNLSDTDQSILIPPMLLQTLIKDTIQCHERMNNDQIIIKLDVQKKEGYLTFKLYDKCTMRYHNRRHNPVYDNTRERLQNIFGIGQTKVRLKKNDPNGMICTIEMKTPNNV